MPLFVCQVHFNAVFVAKVVKLYYIAGSQGTRRTESQRVGQQAEPDERREEARSAGRAGAARSRGTRGPEGQATRAEASGEVRGRKERKGGGTEVCDMRCWAKNNPTASELILCMVI